VDLLYKKFYSKSTTNPQQIHSFTTNPQHLDMSRCCGFVVDSTTNLQQIETVEYGLRLVHSNSKSCTTNPQQIHNKSNKWSSNFNALETLQCGGDVNSYGSHFPYMARRSVTWRLLVESYSRLPHWRFILATYRVSAALVGSMAERYDVIYSTEPVLLRGWANIIQMKL
jgi:hypothetical protein